MRPTICIYIAGPMSGYPDYNRAAFMEAEGILSAPRHHRVLNPARRSDPTWDWSDYMRAALVDVSKADALALLPGWEASAGARLEVHVAHQLGMTTLPLARWIKRIEAAQ